MPRRRLEDPGRVRVRVLGATEITVGHRRIGMNTETLFALALHLTTRAGERIPREELLELFYGESTNEDHRHALRQQMYRLRQKGFDVDDAGELIRLDPERVDSDLRSALSEGWWETASPEAIDHAGEWGPTFSRQRSPGFLEWLDGVRSELSASVRKAALRQIGVARREGRWSDLDRWARPILKSDPLNEEATLARAESAAMSGSKTIALEIIDNYLTEIGEVSADLGKPALQLRKRIAERRPDWAMRGPKEVPLVGRTELMTKLTGLVEDVWKGEGRAVVLTGAAGIGKTRLAEEARAFAELRGMRTILVRSDSSSAARPLSMVQRMIALLLEQIGAGGCHPDSMRLLRQALEQSSALSRHDVAAFMYSIAADIPDAIVDLVEAIAHESRLLIVVDDLHHSDSASLAALSVLFSATSGTRIGWLATLRRNDWSQRGSIPLPAPASDVFVSPLSASESKVLAVVTGAQHGLQLESNVAERVASASGGNPLFVRELAVAKRTRPNSEKLPETLARVIESRLENIGSTARELLRVVAVLGSQASIARVGRALRTDAADLARDVERLERDGILSLSDSRALVLHECWRQSLLDSMAGATFATLGRVCAEAICVDPPESLDPHSVWKAAELYAESGDARASIALFAEAADGLYGAGLPAEAVEAIRVSLSYPCSDADRMAQKARLVSSLVAAGDPHTAISESEDDLAQRLLSTNSSKHLAAMMMCSRVDALFKVGSMNARDLDLLLALASDPELGPEARARCALTGIAWSANAPDRAFSDSFAAAVEPTFTSTPARLVRLIYHAERGSISQLERAANSITADSLAAESPYLRCRALRLKCRGLRILSRIDDALTAAMAALAVALDSHLAYDAAIVTEQLVHLHLDHDRADAAKDWLSALCDAPRHQTYEQSSAHDHAQERYFIQTGKFSDVVTSQRRRDTRIRADWNTHRKLVELATRAFALANVGELAESALAASEVELLAAPLLGHFALDYPIELVSRSRILARHPIKPDDICRRHVEAALSVMPRVFPPFYQLLNESRAELFRT
jgi:DNA-binding SARP family transcriptional activator